MANVNKFNHLRTIFFTIYSDIKLNIQDVNENTLAELYNKLDIFYQEISTLKNNNILLQGFIDNNCEKIKEVKLFLINRKTPRARSLHDKIFTKILKLDSYTPLGITQVFEDFIKGITYFSDELENKKRIPIYHRAASCGNSSKNFKKKYLQCYNTQEPEDIKNKKEHIFKCYLERLIYDDMYKNIIFDFPVNLISEKAKNFNKRFIGTDLTINITYKNHFPIILEINYMKNNVLIKNELFMKTTYIDEYGNTRYYDDVFHKIMEKDLDEIINIQKFSI